LSRHSGKFVSLNLPQKTKQQPQITRLLPLDNDDKCPVIVVHSALLPEELFNCMRTQEKAQTETRQFLLSQIFTTPTWQLRQNSFVDWLW
jgi:hypothetical protein